MHQLIKLGDALRDSHDWTDAAQLYQAALAIDPRLAHVHVQNGHMLREAGFLDAADAAYREAARVRPNDEDAWLNRVRLAEQTGRSAEAVSFLVEFLKVKPQHREAADILMRLLDVGHPLPLQIVFREFEFARSQMETSTRATLDPLLDARAPLVFDLTDLIAHFRHHRLPNGIQRVQIEVMLALLADRPAREILACCFVNGRDGWSEVPIDLCRELMRLAGEDDDIEDGVWQIAKAKLFFHIAMALPYDLPFGSTLINLGTSFWMHDYFRFIRNAKADRNIRYVPMIYDMIPVVRPDLCVMGWRKDFTIWLVGLFQHADAFLAISHSAKRDLLHVAAELGHKVDESLIEVVPLDADFRRAHPSVEIDDGAPASAPFALMVATIEPRKNHILALDAWAELIRRHGSQRVPRLICVGRDGWMNDEVFDRLDGDPLLAGHVTLAYQLSDAALAQLYRTSLFTVFPSLYEGWGLPVTEALCYGRLPLVADNSSLPEAGGGFATLFADNSLTAFIEAIEKATFCPAWRAAREADIAANFHARRWSDIAAQIGTAARRLTEGRPATIATPTAACGIYYPVNLYVGPGIAPGLIGGEAFRVGDGWLWPTADGCRTRAEGGAMRMRVASAFKATLRLYLRVRGLATKDCAVRVTANGTEVRETVLRRNKARWLVCDLDPFDADALSLVVQGQASEAVGGGPAGQARRASVEVLGFFLIDRQDEAAEADFVAARRADLCALSVYRRLGLESPS